MPILYTKILITGYTVTLSLIKVILPVFESTFKY
nr:MAG TPA: hypothetical protein [Bacteriophage sp.]